MAQARIFWKDRLQKRQRWYLVGDLNVVALPSLYASELSTKSLTQTWRKVHRFFSWISSTFDLITVIIKTQILNRTFYSWRNLFSRKLGTNASRQYPIASSLSGVWVPRPWVRLCLRPSQIVSYACCQWCSQISRSVDIRLEDLLDYYKLSDCFSEQSSTGSD